MSNKRRLIAYASALRFLVCWGGGRGPDVWDDEVTIDAPNIQVALDWATRHAAEAGATIFSIEQYDEPLACRTHIVAPPQ